MTFVESWAPETGPTMHYAAISAGRFIDPNLDPAGRTVTLCGLTANMWERNSLTRLEDIADAAGEFCEECHTGMRALHAAFPDAGERAYVAARAITTMALVRRADAASSQARDARDIVVRRAVDAGITRYRVAQLLGLSETAVSKIVG